MPKRRLNHEDRTMSDRIIFLTGHLALPRLEKLIASFGDEAREWRIINIGVKVAALMTQEIIQRRLNRPLEANRVIVPGRCRADLDALTKDFGVRFERGPEEVADLAEYPRTQPLSSRPLKIRYANLCRNRGRDKDVCR